MLPSPQVDKDVLTMLLKGRRQVIGLELDLRDSLPSSSLDLFRPHFSTLRKIDCPSLEEYRSIQIHASTIANGKPWVCLKPKVLHLDISFDPKTIRYVQPHVMDQLSKLGRLRLLCLRASKDTDPNEGVAMDLRLEHGLGRLSTLRVLETIVWGSSKQLMGEQECQ